LNKSLINTIKLIVYIVNVSGDVCREKSDTQLLPVHQEYH